MTTEGTRSVTVEFDAAAYPRLTAVTGSPGELVHEATMGKVELAAAVDYTQDGGFHGPNGFAKLLDADLPTWPLGSLLGIEFLEMGDGESRWRLDAGPEHANPGARCMAGCCAISATPPCARPTCAPSTRRAVHDGRPDDPFPSAGS